jgi:hypothetical protein
MSCKYHLWFASVMCNFSPLSHLAVQGRNVMAPLLARNETEPYLSHVALNYCH